VRNVCFVVSSLGISGGLYVVLQHAAHMVRSGIDVTIATPRLERASVGAWHPAWHLMRHASLSELADSHFDLALGTWWASVYDLPVVSADRYAYFIQNADHLLAPAGLRRKAEATYSFGLGAVTVSEALARALADRYDVAPLVARNGIDKLVFRPDGASVAPKEPGKFRVLVEGPLGARTKGVAYAVHVAQQAGADEIWLLTSSPITWYPGVTRVFSGQNAAGCAAVYRSCDVLLKLSSLESCSLPILEMLHCGGTVVTYDIPSPNEYLVDRRNAMLLPMGDGDAIVEALRSLRHDHSLRKQLLDGALECASQWPTWQASSSRFLQHCLALRAQSGPSRSALRASIDAHTSVPSPSGSTAQNLRGALKAGLALVDSVGSMSSTYTSLRAVMRAKLLEQKEPAPEEIWLPKKKATLIQAAGMR
jgi:glycosyltransferase involved in cell wall biosynthesis